ncbi:cytochrome bd-I ubiquinol oxidase subunit 2 apoprotein [Desulfopila aestuarii DSM 18488]|uniref:Cytochrome bd-I ubiquinol oxidase subunit 2 apoprotein n=1 Tax=Desulfopila aestuarii DSM 18488 TaxID=1121416 RepID=A0A1M7YJ59_9BACT|nr:cytochrome d ubiquinol oxidase subunit II [Desulfopila aestuarii]SHO52558.1 cytochrome bd-I ubiquinol oxidase subunit 2 apoprotein [Desulfopila aestuarii DSM 18488]
MLTPEILSLIWFALLIVLLAGYAILDGFDLGVGILHPFVAKTDTERRLIMNSIGPLWDGNEVWLVTFGGALFAMFPNAYASIFSAFYLPFVFLLFALIFRAVSLEFRSKRVSPFWRTSWDIGFFAGSALAAFLYGVAIGRVMQGLELSELGDYQGTFFEMLTGFAISVGVLSVALLAMHGSIYLYLKTEGELQQRLIGWMKGTYYFYVVSFVIVTIWSVFFVSTSIRNFGDVPLLWLIPALNLLAIWNIPRAIKQQKPFYAFMSSCGTITALILLFSAAIFPDLLPASNNPEYSINIFNGASSQLTQKIGLIIVAIGMPMVLSYTIVIYWTFRGKVELDDHSY